MAGPEHCLGRHTSEHVGNQGQMVKRALPKGSLSPGLAKPLTGTTTFARLEPDE
jgi:hypothetical protein